MIYTQKKKYLLQLLFIATIVVFYSCSKGGGDTPTPLPIPTPPPNPTNIISPSAGDIAFNVSIDSTVKGIAIPSSFMGLSYETGAAVSAKYMSSTFTKHVNLIKNLGSDGVIRIGGNSSDKMFWSNSIAPTIAPTDTIYRDQVDRFFGFANAIGWKSMFGLNVGQGTVTQSTDEVKYINSNYANNILYYELGNEPDYYHSWIPGKTAYTVLSYQTDFENFYNSIHAIAPAAKFSGPTTCCHLPDFAVPFVTVENSKLAQVTHHYYSGTSSAAALLKDEPNLAPNTTTLVNLGKIYNMPFRWSECNSISGGGLLGVSNKLASALWGIDFMYITAKLGCAGVNFHGGSAGNYTPIEYGNFEGINGNVRPRPLYYGMLAFSLGSKGKFIQNNASVSGGVLNCKVYTILGDDGKYYITVINKDLSSQAYVKITGMPVNHTTLITRLIGTVVADPAIADNVILGNAIADPTTGIWTNAAKEKAGWDYSSYQLQVPASSIAILVIPK